MMNGCNAPLRVGEDFRTLTSVLENALNDKRATDYGHDANKVTLSRGPGENGMFFASMEFSDAGLPPSTKLTATMAVILSWRKTHPKDKIIVFTQWVMSGKILGTMLGQANMPFVYNFGCMNQLQRAKALHSFKNDEECNILVGSAILLFYSWPEPS
jgi:SNF2 family DNA or RNA helicase